jgi:hypothetical protein
MQGLGLARSGEDGRELLADPSGHLLVRVGLGVGKLVVEGLERAGNLVVALHGLPEQSDTTIFLNGESSAVAHQDVPRESGDMLLQSIRAFQGGEEVVLERLQRNRIHVGKLGVDVHHDLADCP